MPPPKSTFGWKQKSAPMAIKPPLIFAFAMGFTVALMFSSLVHLSKVSDSGPAFATDRHGSAWGRRGGYGAQGQIKVFIGVQTGFTYSTNTNPKYDYTARRQMLRHTWFPASRRVLDELEKSSGIVMRFVIGHSHNEAAEAALLEEEKQHGGFLRLSLTEDYNQLTAKTLSFLRTVMQQYTPAYIIKVDDDVYLRPDRVPAAIQQWQARGADYIGCMKNGQIFKSQNLRWYESYHEILGTDMYFTHAWGSIYALSGATAGAIVSMQDQSLRFFANEDVTIGAWMLALNVTHYDDRRLCERTCTNSAVAVWDMPKCAGLCDPVQQLPELYSNAQCQAPMPATGLPVLAQVFFKEGSKSLEQLSS